MALAPNFALVGVPSSSIMRPVDLRLAGWVLVFERGGDGPVDICDCFQDALAAITLLITVPQLQRLILPG